MHDECIKRNERPAYVRRRPLGPNCGINLTNSSPIRERGTKGGPEMVALKMAVDGTLIVLDVSPVIGEAWERRVAGLG
jgi:hypothetical protein